MANYILPKAVCMEWQKQRLGGNNLRPSVPVSAYITHAAVAVCSAILSHTARPACLDILLLDTILQLFTRVIVARQYGPTTISSEPVGHVYTPRNNFRAPESCVTQKAFVGNR